MSNTNLISFEMKHGRIYLNRYLIVLTFFMSVLSAETYSQTTWTPKANQALGRVHGVGFSIGNKGYVGTGVGKGIVGGLTRDFWEWDQATDVWTQKADFGGTKREHATGFSVGNKGYIGLGSSGGKDFWEWDQATNVWTQKPNYPGSAVYSSVGFSIGSKGYFGTGGYGTTELWEWDPAGNAWNKKLDFGGTYREGATGFSIGNKGYIGTGWDGLGFQQDLWEWDQAANAWTQKANCPGTGRWYGVGFSIGAKGYVGTGEGKNNIQLKDFWEWDQATNTWVQKPDYQGGPVVGAVGFSIGNYGYVGSGCPNSYKTNPKEDFWEFCPTCPPPCVLSANIASSAATLCIGSSATVSASGGTGYTWNTGATTPSIVVSPSVNTSYTVIVSDASGCKDTVSINVPVKNCCSVTPAINSDPAPNTTFCVGQNVYLAASGGTSYVWSTGETGANIAATLSVTTTYSVTVTDANGCTGTSSTTFIVDPNCTTTGISQFNDASHQITIWPNPSNGMFNVEWLMDNGNSPLTINRYPLSIEIYNVMGEKVYSGKISNPQPVVSGAESSQIINLDLPDGIYYLQVKTDPSTGSGGTITQKLIINK